MVAASTGTYTTAKAYTTQGACCEAIVGWPFLEPAKEDPLQLRVYTSHTL